MSQNVTGWEDQVRLLSDKFGVEIPPKVFREMEAEVVDYVKNKLLRVKFPVLERYANPVGHMQGGMIAAAFDNTFGPFSYLVARRPCVTVNFNLTFMRPIKVGEEVLTIDVFLRAKSSALLLLEGHAHNASGKLVATATTTMAVQPGRV